MIDIYKVSRLRPPTYNDVDRGTFTFHRRLLGFGPNGAVVVDIHQTRYFVDHVTVEDWRGYIPGRMNNDALSKLHTYGERIPNSPPLKDIVMSKPKIRRWYHDINR